MPAPLVQRTSQPTLGHRLRIAARRTLKNAETPPSLVQTFYGNQACTGLQSPSNTHRATQMRVKFLPSYLLEDQALYSASHFQCTVANPGPHIPYSLTNTGCS